MERPNEDEGENENGFCGCVPDRDGSNLDGRCGEMGSFVAIVGLVRDVIGGKDARGYRIA